MNKKKSTQDWIKHWAGHWQLLNNSLLGYQYTKLLKTNLGKGLSQAVFISKKDYSTAYLNLDDYKKFSLYLSKKILTNTTQLKYWTDKLVKQTDVILKIIKKIKTKNQLKETDALEFIKAFYAYGVPHRVIKVVVDSLPADKLKKFLPALTKARLYSEPVYQKTEECIEFMGTLIAKTQNYNPKHLPYLTKEEFTQYWENKKLPSKKELLTRYKSCTIVYTNGRYKLYTGNKSKIWEKMLETASIKSKTLKGFTAYPGKIKGVVQIVLNPIITKAFKEGNILVTGMTRPEYIPFIKKSGGFITDAGGMLSHAAITARELKKPCIVGTMTATKQLKTGDVVKLDATNGIITKIK